MRRFLAACLTLIWLVLMAAQAQAINVNGACPVTVGTITAAVTPTRTTCISPCLIFFDATGTTDSAVTGNTTVFQDDYFGWNFGDTLKSGTTTWPYGSMPGVNARNKATGGIAAHLFITEGRDTKYTATVTVKNGTSTAVCGVGVTVYDPSGSNGFPGTATTCVAASTTPVAGAGGCPSAAGVLNTASFATALGATYMGNGKRVLFKCGDTFTGDNVTVTAITASIGAYGGCEGTQTSQPIFSDTSTNCHIEIGANTGDLRISDIYFNGNGTAKCAVETIAFVTQNIPYQVTLSNLQSTGNGAGYSWSQGAQWGLISSTQLNSRGSIAVFINNEGSNPAQMFGTFPNVNYTAFLGNFVNGVGTAGGSGSGIETVRTAECRLCTYTNNTIENANNVGGVFKLHNANTYQSCGNTSGACPVPCTVGATFVNVSCFTGQYTELVEISDNLFTGNSGGILSDVAPENGGVDERLRNIVIERNLYSSPTNQCCDTLLFFTGANLTLRDNAFYMPANGAIYAVTGAIVAQRGSGNCSSSCSTVQFNEAYNNTCYAPNTQSGQQCIGYDTSGSASAATANSVAKNNLFYVPTTATGPAVHNTGTGNTVSNNTAAVTNNPGFTNGSGSFSLISDYKPTANYSGGTTVPSLYDALGIAWSGTWDLGAVKH